MTIAPRSVCRWGKENDPAHRFVSRTSENPFRALFEEFFVSIKFTNSVASIVLLLVSATFAHAQNVLLFTFDDSGPNATSTVTGSYDTSGLTPGSFFLDEQIPPIPLGGPGPFGTAVFFRSARPQRPALIGSPTRLLRDNRFLLAFPPRLKLH